MTHRELGRNHPTPYISDVEPDSFNEKLVLEERARPISLPFYCVF
jgi:hypothetical protein